MHKEKKDNYSAGLMRSIGKIPFVKEGLVALTLSSTPFFTGCATSRYTENASTQKRIENFKRDNSEDLVCEKSSSGYFASRTKNLSERERIKNLEEYNAGNFVCEKCQSEEIDWEKALPYILIGAGIILGGVYLISASGSSTGGGGVAKIGGNAGVGGLGGL
jgi:hypothetical protein